MRCDRKEVLLSRVLSQDSGYLDNLIFKVVAGSNAHGLQSVGSDIDYKGVFVYPFKDFAGLNSPRDVFNGKDDEGNDYEYVEVGKYIPLLLRGNPTYLETLWCDTVLCTEVGEEIRENRNSFLSKRVFASYGGYAIHQFKRMFPGDDRKPKHSFTHREGLAIQLGTIEDTDTSGINWKQGSHLIRLLVSGEHLLRTGEMLLNFEGHHLHGTLMDIKSGKVSLKNLMELSTEWETRFNEAFTVTVLPDEPDSWANEMLVKIRLNSAVSFCLN